MSKFEQMLKEKLTASAFETLFVSMQITKTRLRQMLNNPERMTAAEISKVYELLPDNEKIELVELIMMFHLGYDTLSISDMTSLTQMVPCGWAPENRKPEIIGEEQK